MNISSSFTKKHSIRESSGLFRRTPGALAIVALLCLGLTCELAQARPIGPINPDPPPPTHEIDFSVYFSVRPDLRKCPSPQCGGIFVRAVNQRVTRCLDGRLRPECYVAEVDLAALKLPPDDESTVRERIQSGTVLLQGRQASAPFSPLGAPGAFVASKVWLAATDVPASGVFSQVRDAGLACIAAPCLSFQEVTLNTFEHRAIAGVDLSPVGAGDRQLADAEEALRTVDGILLTGKHTVVSGPAGDAPALVAGQFYLAVQPRTPK
ncbi:MAG: hypothetical protein H6R26_704 [Proteobacteria bacterium]|nr:hypothetical protein [Pseudomonadota bacterium]